MGDAGWPLRLVPQGHAAVPLYHLRQANGKRLVMKSLRKTVRQRSIPCGTSGSHTSQCPFLRVLGLIQFIARKTKSTSGAHAVSQLTVHNRFATMSDARA